MPRDGVVCALRELRRDVGRPALAHDVPRGAAHVLVVVRAEVVAHLVREGHGAVVAAGGDLGEEKNVGGTWNGFNELKFDTRLVKL